MSRPTLARRNLPELSALLRSRRTVLPNGLGGPRLECLRTTMRSQPLAQPEKRKVKTTQGLIRPSFSFSSSSLLDGFFQFAGLFHFFRF